MCRRRLTWTKAARRDLNEVAEQDHAVAVEALRAAKAVGECRLDGERLDARRRTGNLTDCYKVKVGRHHDPPSHRLVYRLYDTEGSELLVDVVALLPRGCVYPAVGLRLDRIFGAMKSDAARLVHNVLGRNA